ncbi:MAG: hypothetical protein KBD62_37275, partial [Kofleriaceae bacterium]|nr:hypothetical protein [Kofleriaceae bacterium]
MTGLEFQPVFVPFAAGLNTKAHPFALDAPGLTICQNAEFDEIGALRLRHPYTSIGVNIYGGGTLASVRKLAVVGDELLAFTPDALYSWSEALTAWIRKDTHLAVTVTEATRFGNPSDQVFADRAELGGVAVMVWTEVLASAVTAYLGAYDTTTGATLIARTSFGAGNTRPRVVALATKIVVTWTDAGAGLVAKVIDPAAPAFAATGATLLDTEEGAYDIVKDPTADRAVWAVRFVGGGSYAVGAVTSALAVTDVTKARNADGVIAVSVAPSGVVQVLRTYGTSVLGDLLTSAFVDVFTGTLVGSVAGTINQLTGAHRSVTTGGYYRCYAFWSSQQSAATGSNFLTQSRWIDTNNSVGGGSLLFLLGLAVASRAFGYNGEVYLWAVFAGEASTGAFSGGGGAAPVTFLGIRAQFQNAYFLYRDDGHLATKATWSRAGGFGYYDGHLPGVALVSGTTGYAWAGVERQIIVTGGTSRTDYSARAPRDIAFAFDSDAARRVVHFGRTAYVSGGLVLQYDGEALTEVGFCQYPWHLALATNPGGAAAAGVYSYKASYRWDNARGETERSTTAVGAQLTIAANDQVDILTSTCRASRKQSAVRLPALELWRSQVNAPV